MSVSMLELFILLNSPIVGGTALLVWSIIRFRPRGNG
jgi:hypothetical protein